LQFEGEGGRGGEGGGKIPQTVRLFQRKEVKLREKREEEKEITPISLMHAVTKGKGVPGLSAYSAAARWGKVKPGGEKEKK